MAISLKHNFTSAVADELDTSLVRPSNWNAEHDLTLATARLIGRTTAGTGVAEEISVGTGLSLTSGSLSVSSTTPQVNSINTFTVAQVIQTTDNTNPALRITQLGTADALRVEDETSPDATPFVITANGHAIAGYGSTLTIETVVPQFQSHTDVLTEGGFGGVDWGNTATGQVNWFGKSRGGSYGTQGILSSGDIIGDFRFYGSDGVGFIPAAKIEVEVDGTPGVNDMPGRISFFTTADGSATPTERMRINNAGNVGIGVTNPQAPLQILGSTQNRMWLSGAAINSRQLFVRSNGTFVSPTIVASGDAIGSVNFFGYDGAANIELANMTATVDSTPGTNDMPGRLTFSTTADGAASPTERFRIGNAGQWGIGGATYGTSGQAFVSGGSSAAPSWGTVGINGGGTGQTTASAGANALDGYLAITSAAGTTVLDNTTPLNIVVTGTAAQTIRLPDVTTLALGWTFKITNTSTGTVTVQSSGANAFANTLTNGMVGRFICIAVTGTTVGSWVQLFDGAVSRTGTGGLVFATGPALFSPTLNNARYTLETITAGTNAQGQGAIAASTEIAAVTTTAANPSGVTLSTAAVGKRTTVFNLGTNPIVIYPLSGTTINALAVNAGITLPVGYSLLFEAQTTTQWRTQNLGTAGQFLESNGASSAPTWANIANTDVSGLGTMSTQDANSVSISGGSITGITGLAASGANTDITSLSLSAGSASAPSISTTGDTNTGIFFPAADAVAITTGGTQRMLVYNNEAVVYGSGNQQIRSATTDTSGSSIGILRAEYTGGGGGTASSVDVRAGDNYTFVTSVTNTPLLLGTNATERLRIGTSGQLGIGGTNYGTSGQVLTSGGSGAAPSWADAGSGAWVLIGKYTPTNVATLNVTDLSAYSAIRVTLSNIRPASDAVVLQARISSNNGSSYISTSTYGYIGMSGLQSGTPGFSTFGQAGTTVFVVATSSNNIGNAAADGGIGGEMLFTDFNTAQRTKLQSRFTVGDTAGGLRSYFTDANQSGQTAMNAFQLFFSSGNISTGLVCVEGLV